MSLPRNWRRSSLSELDVEAKPGFASGKHAGDGEVVHLRPMNITRRGRLTLAGSKFVDARAGAARTTRGDVLFNNTNSPALVGKSAYVQLGEPLAFSNHMTRLRVRGNLDPQFLAMQLQSMQEAGYFEAICSNHVNQASVSSRRLLQVEVVLPSIDEQRRIVDILEDQLSRLDAASASLGAAENRLATLETAQLRRLLPVDAQTRYLGDLALRGGYGTSTKCVPEGAGVAVVRIPNLACGRIDLADEKRAADPSVNLDSLMLRAGDLLVIRTNGSRDLIGRTAVVQDGVVASFASYLIRFQFDRSLVDPRWIDLIMNAPSLRREIESRAASSAGQFNLSLAKLNTLAVPVPATAEQAAILGEMGNLRSIRERLKSQIAASRRRADRLRRALLVAAFSGQLRGATSDFDRIEELAAAM